MMIWIRLLLVLLVAGLPVLAHAEGVVPVAVFGNARGAALVFATGETNGAKTAAVMAEIPNADGSQKHIVVIFDREHWPRFEAMWRRARYCLSAIDNSACTRDAIDDSAAGTSVSMFTDTEQEVVEISLASNSGDHADFPFANDNLKPLREIGDAIARISDYLGRSPPSP
jgi:hypothetical protein